MSLANIKCLYIVFIQIDVHALMDVHALHHQAIGIQKWVIRIKNAWIYDHVPLYLQLLWSLMIYLKSDFEPIIMYQLHVLLTPRGLLLE